jgi:hypothetical protein
LLLNEFQKFIRQHGEGALVSLNLLQIAALPWLFQGDSRSTRNLIGTNPYPCFNMLYWPMFANREPLQVLLTISKLAELLDSLNLESDCDKYYWWTLYGDNPYEAAERSKHSFTSDFPPKTEKILHRRQFSWGKIERKTYFYPPHEEACDYHTMIKVEHLFLKNTHSSFINCINQIIKRDDFQCLNHEIEDTIIAWIRPVGEWENALQQAYIWEDTEYLERIYLMARACDIFLYGQEVADLTFPQPSIAGATSELVTNIISSMVTTLQNLKRKKEKEDEDIWYSRQIVPLLETKPKISLPTVYEKGIPVYIEGQHIETPSYLPPRIISVNEKRDVINACYKELTEGPQSKWGRDVLTLIEEFFMFINLLIRPENHIKTLSSQYVEKPVNTRTYTDMEKEMAHELTKLDPRIAYANVLQEVGDVLIVKNYKIEAAPPQIQSDTDVEISSEDRKTIPEEWLVTVEGYEGRPFIKVMHYAILQGHLKHCMERGQIEEDLHQRRKNWRRSGSPDKPPPSSS